MVPNSASGAIDGRRVEIRGIVQGVGFRPWVYRLAGAHGLGGWVRNDARGVTIEAFGPTASLDAFVRALQASPPPAARIADFSCRAIAGRPDSAFHIVASEPSADRRVSIPADLATCPDCLREISDPADRRYRYPFTNCTNCGPRFTIAIDIPYDRPNTTMAPFRMCPACQSEYSSPSDRRFHAQPNACPACGPRLWLAGPDGRDLASPDPIAAAAEAIGRGLIVAVKGVGGFHLACDATSAAAVAELRVRKRRDEKPFAVMTADLAARRGHRRPRRRRAPSAAVDRAPHRARAAACIGGARTQRGARQSAGRRHAAVHARCITCCWPPPGARWS